jgi:hypothetical protein
MGKLRVRLIALDTHVVDFSAALEPISAANREALVFEKID